MIKITDSPFLDFLIDHLAKIGFRRFILCVGYKSKVISSFFLKHKKSGLKINISKEQVALGTGGAIKNARKFIKSDPFLVFNGDSFCECEFFDLLVFHKEKKALATIALIRIANGKGYGKITLKNNFRITGLRKKKPCSATCFINAGIYVFQKKMLSLMPNRKIFSLENDFLKHIFHEPIFGFIARGLFFDIGTPARLKKAKYLLKNFKNSCERLG